MTTNPEFFGVKRNVVTAVIFSIITCSIYAWYWLYKMLSDMYRLSGKPSTAGMDILLSIITCNIYLIYLFYKMGKLESEVHAAYNMPPRDDSLLYLILGLFGLWIVSYALIQSNLNTLVDMNDGHGPGSGGPGPGLWTPPQQRPPN